MDITCIYYHNLWPKNSPNLTESTPKMAETVSSTGKNQPHRKLFSVIALRPVPTLLVESLVESLLRILAVSLLFHFSKMDVKKVAALIVLQIRFRNFVRMNADPVQQIIELVGSIKVKQKIRMAEAISTYD